MWINGVWREASHMSNPPSYTSGAHGSIRLPRFDVTWPTSLAFA